MSDSLFITGASGYLGRQVLKMLDSSRYGTVYCLVRQSLQLPPQARVQFVQGDVLDPDAYSHLLAGADVLHLAALTGKAKPAEYFRINCEGTRALVDAAKRARCRKFLYVSTIAVKFRKQRRYFYAQSKAQAEEIVARSGLDYAIVRPTIIAGERAPVLQSLRRLACAPVIPVFGDGRTKVQPINVQILAGTLLELLQRPFSTRILELGGDEVLSIEEFLLKIRSDAGLPATRTVHFPLDLLVAGVGLMERFLLPLMPLTAGQLASFANDGTVDQEPRTVRASSVQLDRECRIYSRYLTAGEPSAYVLHKYRDYHERTETFADLDPLDRFLIRFSSRSPFFTRLADSYASRLRPHAALRKKLVLMVALLECSTPSFRYLDSIDSGGRTTILLRLAWRTATYVVASLLSMALLLPVHLGYLARSRT